MSKYPKILLKYNKLRSTTFWYYLTGKKVKGVFLLVLFVFLIDRLFPLNLEQEFSKSVYSSEGVLLTAYLTSNDKWRLYSSIDDVSPLFIKTIIEKEDKWFYWHLGVNPVSIFRAMINNVFVGKRTIGASTISMQVIRLYNPAERTYWSKIKEVIRALQLELHYSKREILELYISKLPYGGNVEGVKSASYIYLNQSPEKLSLAQSVLLACIPNNPNKFRIDKNVGKAVEFRNKLLRKFKDENIFLESDIRDAINEPVMGARYEMPNHAPHFSYYVAQSLQDHEISSTLKYELQLKAEQLLKNYVERAKAKSVNNGALMIIDNKSMEVISYLGSSDFYDNANSGQVNGVIAVRSPGSTLKPALYAIGFDLGLITPKSKMLDIPLDYGGYAPENYDLVFNGWVSTDYALVNSLNLPAVRLLKAVSTESFLKMLTSAGFYEIEKQKSKLGLSVILGGCGVRLDEMARLFTGFANNGNIYNLNYVKTDNKDTTSIRLFSPEACFLVSDILSKVVRPDFPLEMTDNSGRPKIAWKTGTSFGKRDAWTIGYNPNFTIAVWLGNFTGIGSPHLSGAEMAVPLLFDLFNATNKFYKHKNQEWFKRPKNIGVRQVCSETGLLPTDDCNLLSYDYYIKSVSSNKSCDLYKETYVSIDEKTEYCVSCLPQDGYKKKKYPFYDPELLLWYEENNVQINKPPKHNENCAVRKTDEGPKIISPFESYEYYLEKDQNQQIMLQAASQLNTNFHYWYVNNVYLGKIKSSEKLFFNPKAGKNYIVCMDDRGRTSEITIIVKVY